MTRQALLGREVAQRSRPCQRLSQGALLQKALHLAGKFMR